MKDKANELMTVVVPVKNRATLVLRCLESIKSQTWRPLRVVVVDNGSTDETAAELACWIGENRSENFQLQLVEESRPGPSAARNRGLEEVDSRLMMHFDSDDTMDPLHIQTIMERFAADDYPDLVCFRVRHNFINGQVAVTHGNERSMMETHLVHSLLRTQGFACETALMRRVGGWNENLRCWEDFELGTRLLLESRNRAFIPDVNVDVYAREDSVTGVDFSSKAGEWEKALDRIEETLEDSIGPNPRKWLKFIPYRRIILAGKYKEEGNAEGAEALKEAALASAVLNPLRRAFLRLAYHYTARGGRGASKIYRYL